MVLAFRYREVIGDYKIDIYFGDVHLIDSGES